MINADIYAINLPVGTICVFLVMPIWRKHCLQTARKPLVLLDFFKSYNFTPTILKRPSTFVGGLLLCLCLCGFVDVEFRRSPIITLGSKLE